MQKEFEYLHQKLDVLVAEVKELKALLLLATQQYTFPAKTCTVREAAAYLRLSVARVHELVYTGKLLPSQRKKYSRLLFTTEQLNQYLYANQISTEASSSPVRLPIR